MPENKETTIKLIFLILAYLAIQFTCILGIKGKLPRPGYESINKKFIQEHPKLNRILHIGMMILITIMWIFGIIDLLRG